MIKKIHIIIIVFFVQLNLLSTSFSNINIVASVNDEIITNYDVLKESKYLKILNPKLNNLSEKELLKLSTNSLVKEMIKIKEISKFLDLNKENLFVDEYLENLLKRLKYQDKKTFINNLSKNKTYTIEEIKKKIKIELFWNELIFNKYNNQIIIDEKEIIQKVNNLKEDKKKEFFLSEIIFKKEVNEKIGTTINKIKKSIDEIGFENTATIYSISNSSKLGGKIGWVKEEALSKEIFKNIVDLNINEYSDIIKINDNYIILKINEIKIIENKINKKEKIQALIQSEKNQKLEKFSRIYYNKVQTLYSIDAR